MHRNERQHAHMMSGVSSDEGVDTQVPGRCPAGIGILPAGSADPEPVRGCPGPSPGTHAPPDPGRHGLRRNC